MILGLGLLPYGTMLGTMADGSERFFPVYTAIILWHGKPRLTYVSVVESEPLLGMDVLHGSELAMQIVEGGEVAISEIRR
jgi:predicted aspartyl protease